MSSARDRPPGRVVPIRPEPEPAPPAPVGALGLHWTASHRPDTRRWRVLGSNEVHAEVALEVHSAPARIMPEALARLVAQLLNDVGEDPANLLIAAHFTPEEP